MKYFKILFIPIMILIVGITISCERDDICPAITPTTPNLIIDLLDYTDEDSSKNVFKLVVIGVDNDEVLSGYEIVTSNQLVLPLKTTDNTTQYALINNYILDDNDTPDDDTDDFLSDESNIDIITINYSRTEVFVSRACGYKTIYENVTVQIESDEDNWIESIQPLNSNQSVEDETETHFNLFH
ncbi:DUF6452 family protein [Algibacter lectus]|uniref:DUF6452 family protein n=1 Tax=Algibacter lectus TaxID=221126 RepID=UPI0026F32E64|nr:DUF6452 family protein [Algibacter lectus]MDO7136674.1 DUF6452 family protein [Algibacter lectus]